MWSLVIPKAPPAQKITLLANLGLTPTKLVVARDRVCWSIDHESNILIVVHAYMLLPSVTFLTLGNFSNV